jgi:hypothetical protein
LKRAFSLTRLPKSGVMTDAANAALVSAASMIARNETLRIGTLLRLAIQ